jgi:dTDP-4-dehydrorhamnose 3,5-epimerase
MEIEETTIADVLLIKPNVFVDDRGFFLETFRDDWLADAGVDADFVQDNHSKSVQGTVRGMHYQIQHPQGKLVRVIRGEIFDVVIDLRTTSLTFGQWVGCRLNEADKEILWVPPGFAHGFLVMSESAEFVYKCTEYYTPEYERTILWNDPGLKIDWPKLEVEPLLSEKDAGGVLFRDAEYYT